MQTRRTVADAGVSDYHAEHLVLQQSMRVLPLKHNNVACEEAEGISTSATCEQSELICAAPGLTRQADLSALVHAAATCSRLAIHTQALLVGDHLTPVTNGRVKSLVTCHVKDRLMEVEAQSGRAITS